MQVSEDIWGRVPPHTAQPPLRPRSPFPTQRPEGASQSPPTTPPPRPLSLFLLHHSGLTCSDGLPGGPDNLALAMLSAPDLALADSLNLTLAGDLPT